jgi:hypothetical protein
VGEGIFFGVGIGNLLSVGAQAQMDRIHLPWWVNWADRLSEDFGPTWGPSPYLHVS